MFFLTYLRRELRKRMRQAIFIALGLALGVGLVVTVSAASAGISHAQSSALTALYGVGTDVTATAPAPGPPSPGQGPKQGTTQIQVGPNGAEICTDGKCKNAAGQTQNNVAPNYSTMSASKVAEVARLHDVTAAAGALALTDVTISFPKSGAFNPQPDTYSMEGVDIGHLSLGPLSSARLTSGHSFTSADTDADVALLDSGYAKSKDLKAGSVITIDKVKFTVIGIVQQPASGSSATDIYLPLATAQSLSSPFGSMKDTVNTVYVDAASAADIAAVSKEISGVLPKGATVTTAASLASEVTGSVSSAAKLANDLGKWLSVLVLIAAFAVACLLTMAAVTRRGAEFGTLKAIGWRSRRIVAQVLGESVVMGIVGAAAGVALGFAGAGIISAIAPKLSEDVPAPGSGGGGFQQSTASAGGGPGGQAHRIGGPTSTVLHVPLHPSVSAGVIVLAVLLAVVGGLLAGAFGSWRIAGLRPAAALTRVA
jgi:putative ABC transport system permease protein